jgi:hypothetical protein
MPATLRKDFDEFLHAPVGVDASGMPLTLLSLLARLGIDPWEEAAELAHLSREPAMQRLAARLEAMPNGPASAADTVNIATRLIALLHRAPPRKAASPDAPLHVKLVKNSKSVSPAIYYLIGLIFMLGAQWALSTRNAPAPMDTTITPDSGK